MAPKSNKNKFSPSTPGSTSKWSNRKSFGKQKQDIIPTLTYEQIQQITDESEKSFIGKGKYASVYKGILDVEDMDTYMDLEEVAVKVYKIQHKKLAENELNAYSDLRHYQNIIPLVGSCFTEQKCILVMKYVRRNLLEVLTTKKGGIVAFELDWSITLRILKQLANGIGALIEKTYVCGDIKPDNILIDEEFNLYLCDFGSCKKGGKDLPTKNPLYCASEIRGPGDGDVEKSDIFSFGVILLQIIMKENDFIEVDTRSTLNKQVEMYKNALKRRKKQGDNPHISILARVEKECQGHVVHSALMESGCDENDAEIITNLGIECTEEHPNARPSIQTICEKLSALKVK